MIQAGKNITQKDDRLIKVKLDYLYHAVSHPKPDIANQINRLRNLLSVNPDRYKELKKQLPYIVAGIFNPPIRHSNNFAWIRYFILDIDHISEKDLNMPGLITKLQSDPRVFLLFRSPGNDGLKVLFKLKEKCSDAQKYKLFYQSFATAFSRQYRLDQVIDRRTCDVTRACFISSDPDAIYNPEAEEIEMHQYINFENHEEVHQAELLLKQDEKETASDTESEAPPKELSSDSIQKIKQILNPNIKIKAPKHIFVPEELEQAIQQATDHLKSYNLRLSHVKDIHYGKQIKVEADNHWAELNIHYGKKGFSIVKSTKSQSNAELCEVAHKVLCEIFIPQHD